MISFKRSIAGAALLAASVLPAMGQTGPGAAIAPVEAGETLEAWIGYTHIKPRGTQLDLGYVGFTRALNGVDLYSDGWILRGEFTGGSYRPSVEYYSAAMMMGYRWALGPGYATAYVGTQLDYHSAPADFFVTGAYGGGRVALEYQVLAPVGGWEYYGIANYVTIFDTAWAYARLGYRFTENFRFGPEGQYSRDRFSSEYRAGAFLAYWTPGAGTFWLGGGHLSPSSSSGLGNGYYVYAAWSVTR